LATLGIALRSRLCGIMSIDRNAQATVVVSEKRGWASLLNKINTFLIDLSHLERRP